VDLPTLGKPMRAMKPHLNSSGMRNYTHFCRLLSRKVQGSRFKVQGVFCSALRT
jgi:hypothetical protein